MGTSAPLNEIQRDELIWAVRERYGLHVTELDPLQGELDWNFRATDIEGTAWFIRLTPEPGEIETVEWQNRVIRQLEKRPLSVEFPRLIAQRGGAYHSSFRLDDERSFLIRLTSWVRGKNASELGATTRAYRAQVGELAAEIVECLRPLNSEASGQQKHHWTAVTSGDSIRSTMDAASQERRLHLVQALDWFDAVSDRIPELPSSVVHQDLHDFNLLATVDEDGLPYLSGVVDFNDAVLTARVAELAVAASYATLRQRDVFPAFCDVVEGYLRHATLTELELELLYPLGVARLAVNASTWTHRSTGQNGAYAISRMAATWPALISLLQIPPDVAGATFRSIAERSAADAPDRPARIPSSPHL